MPPTADTSAGWRPTARPDLVFRRVGDEWVIFDADGQRLHVLNLAAALVWSHCTGALDIGGIERAVSEAYGRPLDPPGVSEVLETFRSAGLLAD